MMLTSPTTSSWMRVSPVEVLITRACEPTLHEPNYALHLEVAEYINQKKANTPREAAMYIAKLANHRNPHIAILALSLLDTLVQSCGYPFHLQISTKEFLNELVRRFPERPPPFPGPVMSRILELIHVWKETICTDSRWKEDLGNIRDMHRLLQFKGYRFRDSIPRQPNLSAAANIKSPEELEEEDREAQSAKLQELIRRGTPRDLAAAQELMKSLAGANPDAKPDYRSQSLTELNKIEQKIILLNEMLDNVDTARGERFVKGDAYDQVSTILSSARPRLQKWINDAETDDSESLDTFLQINDQINTVLDRYEAFKRGDYAAATNPIPAELSNNNQGISLIDFDDSAPSSSTVQPPVNDLEGLFSTPSVPQVSNQSAMGMGFGGGMGSSMGASTGGGLGGVFNMGGMQPHAPSPIPHNGTGNGMGMGAGSSFMPWQTASPQPSGTPPASIMLPGTPSNGGAPNYAGSSANLGKSPPSMFGGMVARSQAVPQQPQQLQLQQPQQQPQQQQQQQQQQSKDPFADLAGLF